VSGGLDYRPCPRGGVIRLEDPRAHEHAFGAERHHQRRVGRCGDTTRTEQHHRQFARLRHLAHEVEWRRVLLGGARELGVLKRREATDLAGDAAHVAYRLHDVPGAGLALGADHRGALTDAPERLAKVGGAAHERRLEGPLIDVV
jgi:hypothetical protein